MGVRTKGLWSGCGWHAIGVCKDNLRVHLIAFMVCRNKAKEACGGLRCTGDGYFLVLLAVCRDASKALEQTPTKGVSHKILIYERIVRL
nr:hypothetical protein [Candidatus Freyarchaeota archaeon]